MNSIYEVIVKPIITEKSNNDLVGNRYTFIVHNDATKIDVRNAVEKIYKVKVKKVNTVNYEGKTRRLGKVSGKMSDWKKAIVHLAAGQKIEALAG